MTNISSQNLKNKLSRKSQNLTNKRLNRAPNTKKANIQVLSTFPTTPFRVRVPKLSDNYVMAASPASKNTRSTRRRGRPSSKRNNPKRSFKEISEDEAPNEENSPAKHIKSTDLSDNEESSVKNQDNQSEAEKSEVNGISLDSPSSKSQKELNNDSQLDESASGKIEEEELELKAVNSDEEEFYIDPIGETKINHDGELLGDRIYNIHTFTIPSRHPTRLYVWGSTLARCLGATDSHKIISPYPQLKRIYPSAEAEVKELAKTPGYGIKYNLLTARSAYLVFGYRIIRQGRAGTDDYYRHDIHKPRRIKPANFKPTGRTEAAKLLAKSNAFLSIPQPVGRPSLKQKSMRDFEYLSQLAHETRAFNSQLFKDRAEKPIFYDPHTNLYHAPQSTQISNLRVSIVNFDPVPFASVPEIMEKHNIKSSLQLQSNQDYSICDIDKETLDLLPSDIVEEINRLKIQRDAQKPKPIVNLHPIALAEGQPQSHPSFYPVRFNQSKTAAFMSTLDNLNRSNGLPNVDTAGPSILPNIPKPIMPNHHYPTRTAAKNIANISKLTSESGRNFSPRDLSTKARCGVISLKTQAPCKNFISANGKYCDNHYKYFVKTGKLEAGTGRNSPSVSVMSYNKDSVVDSEAEDSKDDPDVYYHCLECGKPEAPDSALPEEQPDDLVDRSITVKCTKCEHQYHLWCVHIHSQTLHDNILKYDWQCSDCKLCSVCNSVGIEEELLFCDSCDRAFHMKCHTPKVKEIPQGDWICHICQ